MDSIFKLFDRYPAIPFALMGLVLVMAVVQRLRGVTGSRAAPVGMSQQGIPTNKQGDSLDRPLLFWPDGTPYRRRDLLAGGMLVLGRTSSGKTTGAGKTTGRAIIDDPLSCGLMNIPKPEDWPELWQPLFEKAGRMDDVILLDEHMPWRCNFLGCLGNCPPRSVVQCLTMIGETIAHGEGQDDGKNNRFYKALESRVLYDMVVPLQCAGQPLEPERMLGFLMTAPKGKDDPRDTYHCKVMERAEAAPKSHMAESDFRVARTFWANEYLCMDSEVRANATAGIVNLLHVFCSGLCKEFVGGVSNFSPDDALRGKWIVNNFCPSHYGQEGLLIGGGLKYLVETAVLRRAAGPNDPYCVIWCDEAHQYVNGFDSQAAAQMRSHRGALVFLTHGAPSFYGALKGEGGKNQADALMGNFSHWVVHSCDHVTAKTCALKLGKEIKLRGGGGNQPQGQTDIWDMMFKGDYHFSFNEHLEPVLDESAFMTGRTGGADNGFCTDAILLRSGEPFRNGKQWQRVTFSQRG